MRASQWHNEVRTCFFIPWKDMWNFLVVNRLAEIEVK